MHTFGVSNASITELYAVASLSRDVHGEPELETPAELAHRVWFEETKQETRQLAGDNYSRDAIAVGSLLTSLSEGDIIEITPDAVGSETSETARKWRVELLEVIKSLPFIASRVRQMELTLSLYRS